MTDQALTTMRTLEALDPLALIRDSGRAESTIAKYTRVLEPYLASGQALGDVDALRAYAGTLPTSRRVHLRAAVSLWARELSTHVKAHDPGTVEGHAQAGALLNRLEALTQAVKVERATGTKAHTWLSPRQVRELMRTCGGDVVGARDRAALGLLVGAGLRRAELAGLRWEHISYQPTGDKMRTVLSVHGKGAKDRVIPISDKLAGILDQWQNWTGRGGFVARSLGMAQEIGDSLSEVAVFHLVQRHGAEIGKPELAPHDLRRSYAQIGYDAGIPITQLSVLLGHASVKTTQRYLNLELDLDVTASDFVPL